MQYLSVMREREWREFAVVHYMDVLSSYNVLLTFFMTVNCYIIKNPALFGIGFPVYYTHKKETNPKTRVVCCSLAWRAALQASVSAIPCTACAHYCRLSLSNSWWNFLQQTRKQKVASPVLPEDCISKHMRCSFWPPFLFLHCLKHLKDTHGQPATIKFRLFICVEF